MKIGLIGLGRMGSAIWQRLTERGCEVVAWDRSAEARAAQGGRGLRVVDGPRAVAQELFAVLREFDDQGMKLVWVEQPPDTAPWEGVNDRLSRAASR